MLLIIFFLVLFGLGLFLLLKEIKELLLNVFKVVFESMFKVIYMIMCYVLIGVFGLILVMVVNFGFVLLILFVKLVVLVYVVIIFFVLVILGIVVRLCKLCIWILIWILKDELILVYFMVSFEIVLLWIIEKMEVYGVLKVIISFVVLIGYLFNLDGFILY